MTGLSVHTHSAIDQIAPRQWDALAGANPFTSHRFLHALEWSGSVGPGTGWTPAHLTLRRGDQIIGAAPFYAKSHSQGEYIFDHGWAEAYQRAGGAYYPKLQSAVPFTPVTGPRLLAGDGPARAALLGAMTQIATRAGVSGVHITFCTGAEAALAPQAGYLHRITTQYHWLNAGYARHDDFLNALSSRKRKALRRERRAAADFGGTIRALTGDDIRPGHWDAFWRFYQDTGARKWGRPYLTRAFFEALHDTMRDDIVLMLALRDGQPIAGALNFLGPDAIYGRWWGCVEDHAFLHFELCYHRAIDWAIAHGLARVEAGAQGEHKLARGYVPVETHSLHWLADAGLHRAVADYLGHERAAVQADMAAIAAAGPYRQT